MSQEDAIFLAKRNIVDSIWKEANLEGITVTFPETAEIFEGRTIKGLTILETKVINNLKHAWNFVLDTTEAEIDLNYIRHVNGLIGDENVIRYAGELREFDVNIGGTDWKPLIPTVDEVISKIEEVMALENPTERGLRLFGEIARGQWFPDGNKRTAQLVSNASLIRDGRGILAIPIDEQLRARELLIRYYETGDFDELGDFLYKECLDGITRPDQIINK
jgi:Fic family protein